MNDRPQENILIGYTKWLLKWFSILCAVLGVCLGAWVGYEQFQNQIIPMIAIKCESETERNETNKETQLVDRIYLIQKRRESDKPFGLYRPISYSGEVTRQTNPRDLWQQSTLQDSSQNAYLFGPYGWATSKNTSYHVIERETLRVAYFSVANGVREVVEMKSCGRISVEEFYERAAADLSKVQEKLEF